jgi:pyridoxine 5-phosphate synthase
MIRLGVNLDHIATLRQARGERYPDPVQAALLAEVGGADNITCHLREDRRHIQDRDVFMLKDTIQVPLNFEMAATQDMLALAGKVKPHAVTLVPERREERTTEGGLNLMSSRDQLTASTKRLRESGILVSLFIEPDVRAVEQAKEIGADAVEFHTGSFCHKMAATTSTRAQKPLVQTLINAAAAAHALGLQAHFGHGLNYTNAQWLQIVDHAEEANIGHAIIGRALWVGLKDAVSEMKRLLNDPTFRPKWD